MFTLSLKSLLSPRLLALPTLALAVIVALAHASAGRVDAGGEIAASPAVIRAVSCAAAGAMERACTVAGDDLRTIR
jgi:hypothetical protein